MLLKRRVRVSEDRMERPWNGTTETICIGKIEEVDYRGGILSTDTHKEYQDRRVDFSPCTRR